MLYRKRSPAMQRLADHARFGYCFHTQGQIPRAKYPRLEAKFRERYLATDCRSDRRRYRRHSLAPSVLVAQHDSYYDTVWWWLMVSDGANLAHQLETLHDITDKSHRLTFGPADSPIYELIQVNGKWSWRMTRSHVAMWENRVHDAIHQHKVEVAIQHTLQAHYSLSRVPGFRGIREDAFRLQGLLRRRWARHWPRQHPLPASELAKHRIGYIRRVPQR